MADTKKLRLPAPVSRVRIGVGLSAGFLLHQTIFAVGSALAPLVLNAMGEKEYAQLCPNSPVSIAWLLASIVPGFAYRHAPPNILERLSTPLESAPEIRRHPAPTAAETGEQALLPNGLPRKNEDTA